MKRMFGRGRYANVTSTLALIVALSGTAYAANTIRSRDIVNGQVRTADLANNAVTSGKVRDGALRARDFRSGELPAGPRGAAGAPGAPGPKGDRGDPGMAAARFFLSARADGTPVSASTGVTVTKYGGQTGAYQIALPQDVTNCVAIANIGESSNNGLPAGEATSRTNGRVVPSLANTVDVVTRNSAGADADLPFNVAVFC